MQTKFSYNKTTIQAFQRQLSIRRKALPVLLRKETALRQALKSLKAEVKETRQRSQSLHQSLAEWSGVWAQFYPWVRIEETRLRPENVAGTRVWSFEEVIFTPAEYPLRYGAPSLPAAIEALKAYLEARERLRIMEEKQRALEAARKKTTQKVNLYEKVQIPAYEEAIRKIKRFLEDKENIATAAKKIAKKRSLAVS